MNNGSNFKIEIETARVHIDCAYEGQRYPTGTALCIGGKLHVCEANSAWKVDRSSAC